MVRLQVQLTETQVRALKRMSVEQGVPMAELIRRGVDRQLNAQTSSARRDHLQRLRERVQQFDSGVQDLAQEHDRYLSEAYSRDGDVR